MLISVFVQTSLIDAAKTMMFYFDMQETDNVYYKDLISFYFLFFNAPATILKSIYRYKQQKSVSFNKHIRRLRNVSLKKGSL